MTLDELNDTELWELARTTLSGVWQRPVRLKRSVSRDRVAYYIQAQGQVFPQKEELYITEDGSDSRSRLQAWIQKNWNLVNSQLPCVGPERGQCTTYACPEGRHYSCHAAAEPHMKL